MNEKEMMSSVVVRLIFEEKELALDMLKEMLLLPNLNKESQVLLENLAKDISDNKKSNEKLTNLAEKINGILYI